MGIKNWWHEVTFDDWPYELPENKKRWLPTWLNEWLGNRTWNQSVLNRPRCWFKGHEDAGTDLTPWCLWCGKTLAEQTGEALPRHKAPVYDPDVEYPSAEQTGED